MGDRTPSNLVNRRLGDFEVIRELGRGGMGIVYEARQVSLNRKVALKVLSGSLGLTSKAVMRFRREAEAAAKLHHTNIVPVYATGEQDGTHFYAMELIDGPSLDHVIRQMRQASRTHPSPDSTSHPGVNAPRALGLEATGPYIPEAGSLPTLSASSLSSDSHYFDTVARLVAEVADALDYAHGQGVIHRDIKPSNLLLAPAGRLSLNDFGLARMLEQPGLTISGEFVGTPRYMSPEQIAVGRIPVDHRTDIYSLGATLYELLTLEPPHQGKSREEVLTQIVHKEPKAPRRVQKKVPVDLDTICLKCLEKDPDRRYQTAGKMAEDLRRYVSRYAIPARRAGLVTRLRKWVRRHPGLAAALSCMAVLAVIAACAAYQAHRSEQERLAERERAREQLLAEKLDKALLVATSGDLDAAEKAIRDAELAGASTGQVRLLRGQVAYFRGATEAAIQHLEQAVKLLPQSLSARGVLAVAFMHAEQFERFAEERDEVKQRAPITAEDYLFKGYAIMGAEGHASMDEAIRRRDSPIGRLLRTEVRCYRAGRTADPADAERALEDANRAKGMLPDNPYALAVSSFAHLVAAGAYEDAGQPAKGRAALLQVEHDDRALDRFPPLPSIVWSRCAYLHYVGRKEAALEVLRRCSEQSNDHQTAFSFGVALAERGDFANALEILDRRPRGHGLGGDILRAYVLAELPDGPARALAAYSDMTTQNQKDKTIRYLPWSEPSMTQSVLRLVGRKAEAVAAWLEVRRGADRSDDSLWSGFVKTRLDYNCDLISADELVRAAGNDRSNLAVAHYDIALTKLADGDRTGAREHFQKCLASRFFACWQIEWSRMFLAHMDKDPTWPPWIPVKR